MELYFLWIVLLGFVAFFLYAADKRRARRGAWRIKESVLLLISLFGGFVGGLCGMYGCRHKTRHWYFVAVNWLSLFVWVALGFLILTKVGFLFF
ncbi:MAG: DUF1294 domain-containing protein [Clostridia bacterium]|nr:DUF1294 domain-containing protein [Clostridia bacterium]